MADAAGGSNWGPFEVIIVLVLAIGLLSNITGKTISPVVVTTKDKKEVAPKINDSANRCGLSITSPLSQEKVSYNVRLSGLINGCNWKADGNKLLYAQIVDGSGVPVSDFITVENNNSSIFSPNFDIDILIRGNPTGTGYLILVPATQTPEKPISVRIPLKFVRR